MSYTALYFVESGTETTHIVAWDPDRGRWVVPCGLCSVKASRPALFRFRLCGTCNNRTLQVRPKATR